MKNGSPLTTGAGAGGSDTTSGAGDLAAVVAAVRGQRHRPARVRPVAPPPRRTDARGLFTHKCVHWVSSHYMILNRFRQICATLLLVFSALLSTTAQEFALPSVPTSVKFAVIGDSGTGEPAQYQVAAQMTRFHATFAFDRTSSHFRQSPVPDRPSIPGRFTDKHEGTASPFPPVHESPSPFFARVVESAADGSSWRVRHRSSACPAHRLSRRAGPV